MKISEISKKVNLPIATIRYYCDLDMVPSVTRDLEGQRIFDREAIVWLEGIKFQRELGLSLPEIKEYMKLCQQTGLAAVKKRHIILLKQQKKAEQNVLKSNKQLIKINLKIKHEEEIIKKKRPDSLSAARRFN